MQNEASPFLECPGLSNVSYPIGGMMSSFLKVLLKVPRASLLFPTPQPQVNGPVFHSPPLKRWEDALHLSRFTLVLAGSSKKPDCIHFLILWSFSIKCPGLRAASRSPVCLWGLSFERCQRQHVSRKDPQQGSVQVVLKGSVFMAPRYALQRHDFWRCFSPSINSARSILAFFRGSLRRFLKGSFVFQAELWGKRQGPPERTVALSYCFCSDLLWKVRGFLEKGITK